MSYSVQREATAAHTATMDGITFKAEDGTLHPSSSTSLNRTTKVAKKRFSDHGDHHSHSDGRTTSASAIGQPSTSPIAKSKRRTGNIVRKMTINANELFRVWQAEHVRERKSGKPLSPQQKQQQSQQASTISAAVTDQQQTAGDLSPHRQAFSLLALDGERDDGQQQHPLGSPPSRMCRNKSNSTLQSDGRHEFSRDAFARSSSGGGSMQSEMRFLLPDGASKNHLLLNGSLSAVIESASQNSSQTQIYGDNGSIRSKESRGSSSIATRSSMGTRNSLRSFGAMPPRGKCLTQPSEGVSNDSLDNADGNLIVHENDSITVSRKQVHALSKEGIHHTQNGGADFRIQSLLGQGTSAQVFQCLHVQTGKVVAVKVVKNIPAYTRQAAVEIDVLRALTRPSAIDGNTTTGSVGAPPSPSDPGGVGGAKGDTIVDMLCYFMYKDHLCLVFEQLGANLYEVLKKRQFRGLPLVAVRTLMRQAILGTKELAQRSIVHCDLKPENILLMTEDDVDSLVSAGEHKRLSSSLRSASSMDRLQKDQEPPISTTNIKTNGHDSGNSSSTCTTENTNKKSRESTAETVRKHNEKISETLGSSGVSGMDWISKQTPATVGNSTLEPFCHSPTNSDGTGNTNFTNLTQGHSLAEQRIKLIDFGSACFEGQTAHTYIQSRFYRSPEVLIGLAYDSAIDLWSLGCVAAELFLGLPILPGVHEHDQILRICEMFGDIPDWMLEQGSKSLKYFVKFVPAPSPPAPTPPPVDHESGSSSQPPRSLPQWRVKTQQEYIASLSQSEIRRKGGLAKLEKQHRYFNRKRLSDIVLHKGHSGKQEDKELLKSFIHFLYGTDMTTQQ